MLQHLELSLRNCGVKPPCHVKSIAYRKRTRLGVREQKRIEAFVEEEVEKRVWLQEQIPEQDTLKLPILGHYSQKPP